jgi:hypothetical protein
VVLVNGRYRTGTVLRLRNAVTNGIGTHAGKSITPLSVARSP